MQSLVARTSDEGVIHHRKNPVRIYENDVIHAERVTRTRSTLELLIAGRKNLCIVELGCGTGDITGPYTSAHNIYGFDCFNDAILEAWKRFPCGKWGMCDVTKLPVIPCDILVITEFLEHLTEPAKLIRKWLPFSKSCVISHPINGDIAGNISGGDHCWSFDMDDFMGWAGMGGHIVLTGSILQTGNYSIGLQATRLDK